MKLIARLIFRVLSNPLDEAVRREVSDEVAQLCLKFPIPQ